MKSSNEMINALDILASDGWKREKNQVPNDIIESKIFKGTKIVRVKENIELGLIFVNSALRVTFGIALVLVTNQYQVVCDVSPDTLVAILYDIEKQPHWNPNVLECIILKTIDNNTDITYTVTAPACQGLVTSREFVILRHRTVVDNSCIIASMSIDSNLAPQNKFIRADYGPSCFVITPIADNPNRCELRWLLNISLNGWLPKKVVNMALCGVAEEFLKHLRKCISENR